MGKNIFEDNKYDKLPGNTRNNLEGDMVSPLPLIRLAEHRLS
jgi:hypothetical protein